MLKVMISGAGGKMGGVVARICNEDPMISIVCGVDVTICEGGNFSVFKDASDFKGKVDVIIDFSHPSALPGLLRYVKGTKTPIVVATTGIDEEGVGMIREASQYAPVFFSANMSLGVNLIIELAKKAAVLLEDNFDIEIIEKHHNRKIDAPSGTALAIANAINDVLETKKEYVYDRHNVRQSRDKSELGLHAVRGGTIVGEHEIIFAGNDEVIEISHSASSKEVFAVGAVKAAKFIVCKEKGLYSMKELIAES